MRPPLAERAALSFIHFSFSCLLSLSLTYPTSHARGPLLTGTRQTVRVAGKQALLFWYRDEARWPLARFETGPGLPVIKTPRINPRINQLRTCATNSLPAALALCAGVRD